MTTPSSGEQEQQETEVVAVARRRTILGRPRFAGLVGATVFAWASFMPTMMPRTLLAQGLITALSIAMGYAVATGLAGLVRLWLRRRGIEISARVRSIAWTVLWVSAGFVAVVGGLWMWPRWQNQQRSMLAMDDIGAINSVAMLLVALAVAVVLGIIGRTIGRGVLAIHHLVSRFLEPGVAGAATTLAIVVLIAFLLSNFFVSQFSNWANSAFGTVDDGTEEGIVQPTSAAVSGSPGSLAEWQSLGFQGRTFVASATPTDLISDFHDSRDTIDVLEPIRVYTGIRTADDLEERAAIAVDELDRTGAFDREVLAVVTTTGTGWIDPDAAEALEVLNAGNTAIVGMQYSYLPSWISTLIDKPAAADAGAALFDAVYDRWSVLPETNRPELLVFGLSLGSYGAEAAFAGESASNSLRNLTARADGALLGGPTNANEVWQQITTERDAGSPVWRPEFAEGRTVRFANSADELVDLDPSWAAPRILYVQHASDPVTFWSFDSFYRPPEWMDTPRGPDVPAGGPWFPLVTGMQGVFDLMAGFGAPPGHGHDYRLAWPGAWAQVAPPEGWSAEDTEDLSTFFAELRTASSEE